MTSANNGQYGIAEYGIAEYGVIDYDTIITSNTDIVYANGLEFYKNGLDILYNSFSFKKDITYRRYIFGEDNLSGDKDYRDYNEYDIYAEIQFEGQSKNVGVAGYIISDFGFIYLPTIIKEERDGTVIPAFRPQLKDEFKFDGEWYVIENITPIQLVNNPLGMECLFKIISVEEINPR